MINSLCINFTNTPQFRRDSFLLSVILVIDRFTWIPIITKYMKIEST